jgi:hypothetical protein
MEVPRDFQCPFLFCRLTFQSVTALHGHASSHILNHGCASCGMRYPGIEAYLAHFRRGCRKDREGKRAAEDVERGDQPSKQSREEAQPPASPSPPLNAYEVAGTGEPVWIADEELGATDRLVLFPLPDGEIDDDLLDLLVADLRVDKKISLAQRIVGIDRLREDFNRWWVEQRLFANPHQEERMANMAEELARVLAKNGVGAGPQRDIFSWLRGSVGPGVASSERDAWPGTFAQFRDLVDERSSLIVETLLCESPSISMVHIPLLLAVREVALAHDTVHVAVEPGLEPDAQGAVRSFWEADKFRIIATAVGGKVRLAVWSLFVDKTRLVQHGNRKGHVILACPLNNPRGRFDIVGFVPTITDADAAKCGLSAANAVLMRAHLQQQALRVVLLYGGFLCDSPLVVLESDRGKVEQCRNVLGNVRADGEELCSLLCRVIAASDKHAKKLAC